MESRIIANSRSSSAFSDSLLVLEDSESLEDESLDETSEASSADLGGLGVQGSRDQGQLARLQQVQLVFFLNTIHREICAARRSRASRQ